MTDPPSLTTTTTTPPYLSTRLQAQTLRLRMPYHHAYWHNYYRRPFMFCGPSRLIWFGIGSVATWAWIRHHENERLQGRGWCPSPRSRIDYRAQPQTQTQTAQNPSREWNDYPMMASQGGQGQGTSGAAPGTTNTAAQPPPPPPLQSPAAAEQEYERVRQMRRDAEETISGMSEATIDTMMGALQRLKDRLEERRGQRQFQEIEDRQQTSSTPSPPPEESSRPRHWI